MQSVLATPLSCLAFVSFKYIDRSSFLFSLVTFREEEKKSLFWPKERNEAAYLSFFFGCSITISLAVCPHAAIISDDGYGRRSMKTHTRTMRWKKWGGGGARPLIKGDKRIGIHLSVRLVTFDSDPNSDPIGRWQTPLESELNHFGRERMGRLLTHHVQLCAQTTGKKK